MVGAFQYFASPNRSARQWRYAEISFSWRTTEYRAHLPLFAIAAEAINCAAESFMVLATENGLLLRTGLVSDDGRQSSIDPKCIIDKALDQARKAVLDTPELASAVHLDTGRQQYLALDVVGGSPLNNDLLAGDADQTSSWQRWNLGNTLSVMKPQAILMCVAAQTALISAPGCAAAVRFDWDRRQLTIWVTLYLPSGITLSNSGRALFERRAVTVVEQVLTKLQLQDEAFRQPDNALAN